MYSSYSGVSDVLELFGIGIGLIIFLLIVGIAATIVTLIAEYKVFQKMNIDGWKSLVPGVSQYLQMEYIGMNQKWLLIVTYGSIANCIPILGSGITRLGDGDLTQQELLDLIISQPYRSEFLLSLRFFHKSKCAV